MEDVIIVGAGPAGASAAFYLGQAGLRVRVLEKEKLPRYKACGGGLSPRMLARYFPFTCDPVIEARAQSVRYGYAGDEVTVPLHDGDLAFVMRSRFDAFILEHARAEVHQGLAVRQVVEKADRVEVTTAGGQSFEARYVIGADGANSIVARALPRRARRRPVAAIEVEAPVPPGYLASLSQSPLFLLGDIQYGYAWVFPKVDHLSVGIAAWRPGPGELQARLRPIMARYGIDLEQGAWHGHPIPIHGTTRQLATRRILLAGDAASLADPLTGEGIRLAIKSGWLAAQAIIHGDSRQYARAIRAQIGNSHSLGLGLAGLFYTATSPCYALGVCNPLASRAFIEMLSDRIHYAGLIARIFGTLPLYLAEESARMIAQRTRGRKAPR